jgi:hypothetical protein
VARLDEVISSATAKAGSNPGQTRTPSFLAIWKEWHVYGVTNPRTSPGDGEVHHMLDGIEDLIRHSMRLRALSQRALRQHQLQQGWTNAELLAHLRGDHDHKDITADRSVYGVLADVIGWEEEAEKHIPEDVLAELRKESGRG